MAKHKTAASKTASKAARNAAKSAAKAAKTKKPVKAAAARATPAKAKAPITTKQKVETKKKMSTKSTAAARQKAAPINASAAKAAEAAAPAQAKAKAVAAKIVSTTAKAKVAAPAPAAVPAHGSVANTNVKPAAKAPKLAVATSGGQPAKPAAVAPVAVNGKEPEFAAGDYVVYPTHGVGRIQGVVTQEIAGTSLKVIVINFEKERMTLRVPVSKATNSGLRRLSSRKEMETALKTLKGRSRVRRMMWSRRAQEYEAKINSGDPVSIAEVVRDLYRNAGQPDQSYSERQIYQAALDRLARELAAVEKIDEMAAAQKLESVLRAA